jgi:1-aminocyclopropane-1-carboxylate deaminase
MDLEGRVQALLAELSPGQQARWRVAHDYHCGGFARVSPDLRDFIRQFEDAEGIPLDPVYTGKMLFAVHYWISRGEFGGEPVLAIHTGGLQGRRGFPWLHSAG